MSRVKDKQNQRRKRKSPDPNRPAIKYFCGEGTRRYVLSPPEAAPGVAQKKLYIDKRPPRPKKPSLK